MTLKTDASSSIERPVLYLQMRRLIDGADAENSKCFKFDECWSGETELSVSIFVLWFEIDEIESAIPNAKPLCRNAHTVQLNFAFI